MHGLGVQDARDAIAELICSCWHARPTAMAMSAIAIFVWSGVVDGVVATEILEDEEWLEELLKSQRRR